jgi:glycosyltransferase involved in cell wall biosynthesis
MISGGRSIVIDARVNGFPGAHGLARSVMKLAGAMAPGDDGLALRILLNNRPDQLFPPAELPVHWQVARTSVMPGAVHRSWELARLIRDLGAAVLYVPYPTFTPVICPCPVVVTIHDTTIEGDVGFAGGRHRQAGIKLATSAVLRRSAAVTAPTLAALADIRRYYPTAPSPTLVPNGVDTRPFQGVTPGEVAAARRAYRLPKRFILTVGAHRPHKNHRVLLHALAAMPADVSLVIVGYFDPNFSDPVPGLISELGLESRVRLVPEVSDEALPAVYRAASVFAFPSLAEGFGLPALEAMAAGVPVVASSVPALAEVCGPGAVLVSPHDPGAWAAAMSRLLADPGEASRLAVAGAAVAATASWERGAAELRELLARVAGAGPGDSENPANAWRRRSGAGAHQLTEPSSRIRAGSSSARISVASTISATAMPAPSSLSRLMPDVARAMKTMASSAAAVVTIRPVRSRPRPTAAVVSPVRWCSSRIRDSRNTW